jgi:hypothetical protein
MDYIQRNPGGTPFWYGGRSFTEAEIETIRRITDDPWCTTQGAIARAVCTALNWTMANGQPKLATCRKALQQMEEHGVIWLPLPTQESRGPLPEVPWTAASDPQELLTGSRGDFPDLQWQLVDPGSASAQEWGELVRRYHPLHSAHMAGPQLRYFAVVHDRIVACLGFGSVALKLAARDQWIGWTPAERTAHLSQVVGNRRFLVLPWVQVHGLASSFLAGVARRLPADWAQRYQEHPVLLETFVEHARYAGTAYAAANWQKIGRSTGQGRLARPHAAAQPVRDIWVYPLRPDFRAVLTDGRRTDLIASSGARTPSPATPSTKGASRR